MCQSRNDSCTGVLEGANVGPHSISGAWRGTTRHTVTLPHELAGPPRACSLAGSVTVCRTPMTHHDTPRRVLSRGECHGGRVFECNATKWSAQNHLILLFHAVSYGVSYMTPFFTIARRSFHCSTGTGGHHRRPHCFFFGDHTETAAGKWLDLGHQFEHCFFFGDLNYRTVINDVDVADDGFDDGFDTTGAAAAAADTAAGSAGAAASGGGDDDAASIRSFAFCYSGGACCLIFFDFCSCSRLSWWASPPRNSGVGRRAVS